jgi:hypothetical protein
MVAATTNQTPTNGTEGMHFEPFAPIKAAGDVLVRLAPIINRSTLRKRAQDLRARIGDNPVLGDYLGREHAVELAIDRLFRRQRATGRWSKKFGDEATAEALSFAFALTEVHSRLPPRARAELEQRLYGSLKGPASLAPIVHEMTVAVHLMHRGWDVEFHDLEEGKGFDYIARSGGEEIEVECKRVSADKGRKVHRHDFGKFAGPLLPALQEFAHRRAADMVHLRVEDRLPSGEQDLLRLRSAVRGAMETATTTKGDAFTVDVLKAGLIHPSRVGESVLRQEVERHLGTGDYHFLYAGKGAELAILAVTSERRDQVLTYIYKQLKHAAEQFSQQRPAVIWTYIEGIEPQAWRRLVGDTGLERMSFRYMLGEHRQHVFCMAYSSAGELISHGGGHFVQGGPVLPYNRLEPEYKKLTEMLYG